MYRVRCHSKSSIRIFPLKKVFHSIYVPSLRATKPFNENRKYSCYVKYIQNINSPKFGSIMVKSMRKSSSVTGDKFKRCTYNCNNFNKKFEKVTKLSTFGNESVCDTDCQKDSVCNNICVLMQREFREKNLAELPSIQLENTKTIEVDLKKIIKFEKPDKNVEKSLIIDESIKPDLVELRNNLKNTKTIEVDLNKIIKLEKSDKIIKNVENISISDESIMPDNTFPSDLPKLPNDLPVLPPKKTDEKSGNLKKPVTESTTNNEKQKIEKNSNEKEMVKPVMFIVSMKTSKNIPVDKSANTIAPEIKTIEFSEIDKNSDQLKKTDTLLDKEKLSESTKLTESRKLFKLSESKLISNDNKLKSETTKLSSKLLETKKLPVSEKLSKPLKVEFLKKLDRANQMESLVATNKLEPANNLKFEDKTTKSILATNKLEPSTSSKFEATKPVHSPKTAPKVTREPLPPTDEILPITGEIHLSKSSAKTQKSMKIPIKCGKICGGRWKKMENNSSTPCDKTSGQIIQRVENTPNKCQKICGNRHRTREQQENGIKRQVKNESLYQKRESNFSERIQTEREQKKSVPCKPTKELSGSANKCLQICGNRYGNQPTPNSIVSEYQTSELIISERGTTENGQTIRKYQYYDERFYRNNLTNSINHIIDSNFNAKQKGTDSHNQASQLNTSERQSRSTDDIRIPQKYKYYDERFYSKRFNDSNNQNINSNEQRNTETKAVQGQKCSNICNSPNQATGVVTNYNKRFVNTNKERVPSNLNLPSGEFFPSNPKYSPTMNYETKPPPHLADSQNRKSHLTILGRQPTESGSVRKPQKYQYYDERFYTNSFSKDNPRNNQNINSNMERINETDSPKGKKCSNICNEANRATVPPLSYPNFNKTRFVNTNKERGPPNLNLPFSEFFPKNPKFSTAMNYNGSPLQQPPTYPPISQNQKSQLTIQERQQTESGSFRKPRKYQYYDERFNRNSFHKDNTMDSNNAEQSNEQRSKEIDSAKGKKCSNICSAENRPTVLPLNYTNFNKSRFVNNKKALSPSGLNLPSSEFFLSNAKYSPTMNYEAQPLSHPADSPNQKTQLTILGRQTTESERIRKPRKYQYYDERFYTNNFSKDNPRNNKNIESNMERMKETDSPKVQKCSNICNAENRPTSVPQNFPNFSKTRFVNTNKALAPSGLNLPSSEFFPSHPKCPPGQEFKPCPYCPYGPPCPHYPSPFGPIQPIAQFIPYNPDAFGTYKSRMEGNSKQNMVKLPQIRRSMSSNSEKISDVTKKQVGPRNNKPLTLVSPNRNKQQNRPQTQRPFSSKSEGSITVNKSSNTEKNFEETNTKVCPPPNKPQKLVSLNRNTFKQKVRLNAKRSFSQQNFGKPPPVQRTNLMSSNFEKMSDKTITNKGPPNKPSKLVATNRNKQVQPQAQRPFSSKSESPITLKRADQQQFKKSENNLKLRPTAKPIRLKMQVNQPTIKNSSLLQKDEEKQPTRSSENSTNKNDDSKKSKKDQQPEPNKPNQQEDDRSRQKQSISALSVPIRNATNQQKKLSMSRPFQKGLKLNTQNDQLTENNSKNLGLVLHAPRKLSVDNFPMPKLTNDLGVIIAMHCVGICGSDYQTYATGKFGFHVLNAPLVLGHEGAGIITSIGREVTSVKIGDRVSIDPAVACGKCSSCKNGKQYLCLYSNFIGIPPNNGATIKYFAHHSNFVHRLPQNVSFEEGAIADAFASAVNLCRKAQITVGSSVVVIGAGSFGLMTAIAARSMGATKVLIADIRRLNLDLAQKIGIDRTYQIDATQRNSNDLAGEICEELKETGASVTIDCRGTELTNRVAVNATQIGGKIVLMGLSDLDVRFPISRTITRGIDILTSIHYTNEAALDLIASGRASLQQLITHRFDLRDAHKGFEAISMPMSDAVKIVINCK